MDQLKKAIVLTIHHQRNFISLWMWHLMSIVFYVDSTLQGGNEIEVHNHDVSMFDIPDIKLYCKDKLSCEDHSAGSDPILNMKTSPLDNTVFSDPNQLTQSSPRIRLDSSEVSSDPISNNTNVV